MMNIIDKASELGDLLRKFNDIELNRKILELEEGIAELTRANRVLKNQNEDLSSKLSLRASMHYKRPPFYHMDGRPSSEVFCPKCFEGEEKAVHVLKVSDILKKCPVCESCFRDDDTGHYTFIGSGVF